MRAIGIAIPFIRRRSGAAIDAQAQAHFDRVIADGGLVPSGLSGVNAFFTTIKTIYATSDITTAISVGLDAQVLGYKLGAGAGTTAGQAAQKLYSCSGSSGDVVQTTAASQPLLLVHEGANYYQGVNVTNNAVSTPDAPANRITLDLEIIAYVKHTNNTTLNSLVSKNDGGTQRGYSLVFDANNLVLYYGLTTLNVASSTATIASGSTLWVRCTRNATTGQIQFFTSTNPATTNPQSVTWTQLGATISGLIGPINASGNLPLLIGGYISVNSGFSSLEKIYRLTLSNSIGGAPVVDFNPNQYNAANSQTQWVSTSGETWTINTGTATTGYKGQLTYRTTVLTDGIDDSMTATMSASLISTINNNHGVNFVAKRYINSNNQNIIRFAGDYADNNSSQMWFEGGNLSVNKSLRGTALVNQRTTGNYALTQYFSYSESIVYGGTTTQRLNATNNSGTYFNNTTNKPAIVSGNMVLFNSGVIGILNGSFNTLVITNDGTKFVEINDYIKQINNI